MSTTEIQRNAEELDRLRKEQEDVLTKINKLHRKLKISPGVVNKPGDDSLARLQRLYIQAKDLAETEVRVSDILVAQLDSLLPPGPSVQQRRRPDHPGSLIGEQVVAKDTTKDPEEYIVVKVIQFDREKKEYEVLDEVPDEDEEGGGPRKFKVPHIIPFPERNDPSTALDYQTGKAVLAVFPGTTCLYKATVVNPTRKRKTDDYLLEFDGDEVREDGSLVQHKVPFEKVVSLPEGYRE